MVFTEKLDGVTRSRVPIRHKFIEAFRSYSPHSLLGSTHSPDGGDLPFREFAFFLAVANNRGYGLMVR